MQFNIQYIPGGEFSVPIKSVEPQPRQKENSIPGPVPSPFEIVALIEDLSLPNAVKEDLLRQKLERFCAAHWGQPVNRDYTG